jgi:hypothetical protein
MPRKHQRCGWGLRTKADRSGQPLSGGKGRSAQNRHKRWQGQIDGVRDRLLQDQLLAQCEETLPAKMVRLLQRARLVHIRQLNPRMHSSVICCAFCDGEPPENKPKPKCRWRHEKSKQRHWSVAGPFQRIRMRHSSSRQAACRSDFSPVTCTVGMRKTWRGECEHKADTERYFFHRSLLFFPAGTTRPHAFLFRCCGYCGFCGTF